MSESREHQALIERAALWLKVSRRCEVVLCSPQHPILRERPDVIGWDRRGLSYTVEAKVSADDLRREATKSWGYRVGLYRWIITPDTLEWASADRYTGHLIVNGGLPTERSRAVKRCRRDAWVDVELAWLMWAMKERCQ